MDVSHQFQQIDLFLAKNRLVSVLKQMTATSMAQIESGSVASQQLLHQAGNRNIPGLQQ